MTDMTVSTEILNQLGGRRFLAMTGAKDLTGSDRALSFRVPANLTKDKITHVRITLNARDLYTVEFLSIKGMKMPKTVSEFDGAYAEDLQGLFTNATGLATHL